MFYAVLLTNSSEYTDNNNFQKQLKHWKKYICQVLLKHFKNLPDQGSDPSLQDCRQTLYHLSHHGSLLTHYHSPFHDVGSMSTTPPLNG